MGDDPVDLEQPQDPYRASTFFREVVKENYSGRNDSGVALGSTVLRPARSFFGERDAQFLRHISAYFFFTQTTSSRRATQRLKACT